MDRLIDIARRVSAAEVGAALRAAYEMKDGGVEWHLAALEKLRAKTPERKDAMAIRVSVVEGEEGGTYFDVAGVTEGDEVVYSLSMTPWAEWAAMPVSVSGTEMTEAQIVAHCLYEMTFHGDEEDAAEFRAGLIAKVDEVTTKLDGEAE